MHCTEGGAQLTHCLYPGIGDYKERVDTLECISGTRVALPLQVYVHYLGPLTLYKAYTIHSVISLTLKNAHRAETFVSHYKYTSSSLQANPSRQNVGSGPRGLHPLAPNLALTNRIIKTEVLFFSTGLFIPLFYTQFLVCLYPGFILVCRWSLASQVDKVTCPAVLYHSKLLFFVGTKHLDLINWNLLSPWGTCGSDLRASS